MKVLLVLWGFFGVHGVRGSTSGAPATPEVCDSMAPSVYKHGAPQQTSPSPYKVVVDSGLTYVPGQKIQVRIEKIDPATEDIMGFFIQARPVNSSNPVGSFSDIITGKTVTCGSTGPNNAATHNDIKKKVVVAASWEAPLFEDEVIFYATVAQRQSIYWVKVQSAVISPSSATSSSSVSSPSSVEVPEGMTTSTDETSGGTSVTHISMKTVTIMSLIMCCMLQLM